MQVYFDRYKNWKTVILEVQEDKIENYISRHFDTVEYGGNGKNRLENYFPDLDTSNYNVNILKIDFLRKIPQPNILLPNYVEIFVTFCLVAKKNNSSDSSSKSSPKEVKPFTVFRAD